ncbi:MAG: dienelactone hydrolase family protein [Myxococcota bacterium]|jgi:carboxymethylenebutenolidase|nr:dienelactone hydrolase family protein [Myxococcota bacterium]
MKTQTCEFGFLAAPDSGSHPAVVMIHDVWGLKEHTRDIATRLAGEGFRVLALDLYRGMSNVKIENPGPWIQGLSDPDIVADLHAAAAFMRDRPDTAGHAVGLTGFCMGGMYALLAACEGDESAFAAVAPFYGMLSYDHGLMQADGGLDPAKKPRDPIAAAGDLHCPVLAFFGAEDPYITLDDIAALEEKFEGVSHPHECVTYEGAGHAFMNDTYPDAYRDDAAKDAWGRLVAFLGQHLSG